MRVLVLTPHTNSEGVLGLIIHDGRVINSIARSFAIFPFRSYITLDFFSLDRS